MNESPLSNDLVALRRFTLADAANIQRLAGDAAIAEMTLTIPHPYPDGAAEEWIAKQEERFNEGTGATFAITARPDPQAIGGIGVKLDSETPGEIGYWVGRPFWGRGYGTAALQLLLSYCFGELGLERVHARHFLRNPASGRVMEKAGMHREGFLREYVAKNDREEDLVLYGLSRAASAWPQTAKRTE